MQNKRHHRRPRPRRPRRQSFLVLNSPCESHCIAMDIIYGVVGKEK